MGEGWGFGESFTSRALGTLSTSSLGLPNGGSPSANVKGTYTQLIDATPIASDFAMLSLTSASGARSNLFDIAVGPDGSETVVASNLPYQHTSVDLQVLRYLLPISIPQGQRVAVRHQSAAATQGLVYNTTLHLFRHGLNIPTEIGSRLVTLGADASASVGVAIPWGGSANKKGAWTQITAGSPIPLKMIYLLWGFAINFSAASFGLYDVGLGPSGQEKILFPDLPIVVQNDRFVNPPILGPLLVNIPQGVRIAVRLQSDTSDLNSTANMTILGVG
jgi:hypothetical protein